MIEFFSYIIKCIYIIIPGALAVIIPLLVKNLKFLDIPVDMNTKFRGKPLFGRNKTIRGFVFGIAAAIAFSFFQRWLYRFSFFEAISFVNYTEINVLLFGFLMGFGALFGDLVESFFKRQLDIKPGKPFIPWDQIDAPLGGMVFILPVYQPTLLMVASILLISFLIHIANRTIAYNLGIAKERW